VRGDPPRRDPDPDGRNLGFTDPDTGGALVAPSGYRKGAQRLEKDLLETSQIAVEILPIGFEVDYRLGDQFARAVIGHIAPASRVEEADAAGCKFSFGKQYVFLLR